MDQLIRYEIAKSSLHLFGIGWGALVAVSEIKSIRAIEFDALANLHMLVSSLVCRMMRVSELQIHNKRTSKGHPIR